VWAIRRVFRVLIATVNELCTCMKMIVWWCSDVMNCKEANKDEMMPWQSTFVLLLEFESLLFIILVVVFLVITSLYLCQFSALIVTHHTSSLYNITSNQILHWYSKIILQLRVHEFLHLTFPVSQLQSCYIKTARQPLHSLLAKCCTWNKLDLPIVIFWYC